MQIYTEFQLTCGEQAIKTIQGNWCKYVPVLLEQEAPTPLTNLDEEDQLKALETIDKKLRASGAGAKTASAFSVFKVGVHAIVTRFHCGWRGNCLPNTAI